MGLLSRKTTSTCCGQVDLDVGGGAVRAQGLDAERLLHPLPHRRRDLPGHLVRAACPGPASRRPRPPGSSTCRRRRRRRRDRTRCRTGAAGPSSTSSPVAPLTSSLGSGRCTTVVRRGRDRRLDRRDRRRHRLAPRPSATSSPTRRPTSRGPARPIRPPRRRPPPPPRPAPIAACWWDRQEARPRLRSVSCATARGFRASQLWGEPSWYQRGSGPTSQGSAPVSRHFASRTVPAATIGPARRAAAVRSGRPAGWPAAPAGGRTSPAGA